MASGTISLGTSGAIIGQIVWSSSSNGTSANSSQVSATIQVKKTSNTTASTTGTWTGFLNINGDSRSFSIRKEVSKNSWVTLSSFTITKSHNSDGSGTCYIGGKIQGPSGTSQANSIVQGNSTVTLDKIPRYATISSATNFTDIQNPTIKYSNPAGSSVTTLQACISLTGSTDNISYRDISKTGTSYTFNLTEAERNILRQATPNSNTLTVYFYVKTVLNGSTFYQNTSATMTIVNANPTFSVAYLDTNSTTTAITNNNQQIIQSNSTLRINITNATALKYATLSSAKINVNGNVTTATFSGSTLTFNVGTINVANNLSIPVTVTDSRGNTTTNTLTITVLAWSLPTAIINLQRVSNFYTETNLTVNADYSSLNNNNTITIQYQIKKETDASYGSLVTIQDNVQTTFNADNSYSWNVRVIVTDRIGSTTYNLFLYKGIPLMYWDRILSSIGINCFPDSQYQLLLNGTDILQAITGTSLYDNTSGSNGTINLSDSTANYDKLYIEYKDNDGTFNSTEITAPNGKTVYLVTQYPYSNSTTYIKCCRCSISGTTITPTNYSETAIKSGNSPTVTNTNYIYITKVIGYKY